jgi:hypothetical protein
MVAFGEVAAANRHAEPAEGIVQAPRSYTGKVLVLGKATGGKRKRGTIEAAE